MDKLFRKSGMKKLCKLELEVGVNAKTSREIGFKIRHQKFIGLCLIKDVPGCRKVRWVLVTGSGDLGMREELITVGVPNVDGSGTDSVKPGILEMPGNLITGGTSKEVH